jgi:glycosyltransferase involved in cell wall biosynthesis
MKDDSDWFYYINKTLCYYNYIIPQEKINYLPRVLLISDKKHHLETTDFGEYEERRLNVLWKHSDTNIKEIISSYDPDGILLISDDYTKYENLCKQPKSIRDKWITENQFNENTGQIIYDSSMNNILDNNNSDVISFFTSVYNRGDKVYEQYDNIVKQTYINWEWVIVNDSIDGGKTQKFLENIMKWDPRVKVYEFRNKTKGIIGEAKYRAASLCKGEILAEFDHDDILIENCAEILMNAQKIYKDAGFFYTDALELKEDKTTLVYPTPFACGYGQYRKVRYNGMIHDVQVTPNINPKTIRHIVGVPNHIRAWRRELYMKIGGHNRRLSIADDYEIIVRTFLNTKMVKIPVLGYVQNIHENNSHDITRKDIQRRVRSIMYYYNERISKRFEELGQHDWAYAENPNNPLGVEPKFGSDENYVNYIYEIN